MIRPDPSTLTPEALAYIEILESNLRTMHDVLDNLPRCRSWDDEHPCSNYGTVRDPWARWVCDECSPKVRGGPCSEDGPQATMVRVWNELRRDARVWMPPDPVTAQGKLIKLQSSSLHAAGLLLLMSSGLACKARFLLARDYKEWEDPISEDVTKLQEEVNRLWEVVSRLPKCPCGKMATHEKPQSEDTFTSRFRCDEHTKDPAYVELQYAFTIRNLEKSIEEERHREAETIKGA